MYISIYVCVDITFTVPFFTHVFLCGLARSPQATKRRSWQQNSWPSWTPMMLAPPSSSHAEVAQVAPILKLSGYVVRYIQDNVAMCIHAYMTSNIYIYVYIYMYIYMYIYIYIHTYIYTYTYTHIHIHTCMHAYIYIYIHTHNYAHLIIFALPMCVARSMGKVSFIYVFFQQKMVAQPT